MKRGWLFILFLSLGCSILYKEHFPKRRLLKQRLSRTSEISHEFSRYLSRWALKNTMAPYAAELMRLYLKEKGFHVPDSIWYDMRMADSWFNSHKDSLRDTSYVNDIRRVFRVISRGTYLVITRRVERARFEWERICRDKSKKMGKFYDYMFPKKIMAVFQRRSYT